MKRRWFALFILSITVVMSACGNTEVNNQIAEGIESESEDERELVADYEELANEKSEITDGNDEIDDWIPEANYTCTAFNDGKFHVAENDCFEITEPPLDYTSGYGLLYGDELKYYFVNKGKEIYGIDSDEKIYTISKNLFSVEVTLGELMEGNFNIGVAPKVIEIKEKAEGGYSGLYNVWKINNGYLIIHTRTGKSDYRQNRAVDYTLISDAKYCTLISSNESLNKDSSSEKYTESDLCELSEQYYCLINGQIPPIVEVDSVDGDTVTIHIYEHMDDHDATWDWYYISKTTGKGTNFMGDEIDLSSLPRD